MRSEPERRQLIERAPIDNVSSTSQVEESNLESFDSKFVLTLFIQRTCFIESSSIIVNVYPKWGGFNIEYGDLENGYLEFNLETHFEWPYNMPPTNPNVVFIIKYF